MGKLLELYTDPKQIRVGDIVTIRRDHYPFGTTIVTGIEDLDGKYPQIHLARLHARCESHRIRGHKRGEQVSTMVETYTESADRFIENFHVFVSGPKAQIDNRNGIYTSEKTAETGVYGESVEDRDCS